MRHDLMWPRTKPQRWSAIRFARTRGLEGRHTRTYRFCCLQGQHQVSDLVGKGCVADASLPLATACGGQSSIARFLSRSQVCWLDAS